MDNIPFTSFTVMKFLENVPLREKTMQDWGYSIPVSGTCEPSSVDWNWKSFVHILSAF